MSGKDDGTKKPSCFRIILLTSLVWLLFDAGLILYLNDLNSNITSCDPCNQQLQRLQVELAIQQQKYNNLASLNPVNESEDDEKIQIDLNRQEQSESESKEISQEKIKRPEDFHYEDAIKQSDYNDFQWFQEDFSNAPTNPPNWHGENGRGVVMPEKLKEESKKRFAENQFDIVASDLIALNRTIPDQRSEACRNRKYPVDLPNTSIIIVYHNEGNTTLLRGLTSIVNKSPLRYLHEIILVDDASVDREYLLGPLDEFVKTLPVTIKIIRNQKRLGLMRSRLRGAEAATGDTMTFLDAHIECTNGWLPPLLYEIKKNRKAVPNPIIDVISDQDFSYVAGSEATYGGFDDKFVFHWIPVPKREDDRRHSDLSLPLSKTVASPVIDVISDDNFAYRTGSEATYGGFNEKLNFRWIPIADRELDRRNGDKSLPARTPTMAGGLFIIDRKYFYELGSYDDGMDIWGAENLEISFRIWMCGGTLLILPCSHVGHVFRKKTPYKFPGGTNKVIFRNTRRLVDVWTDEYVSYFHNALPDLLTVEAGDLSKRVQLREDLKCKSFRWYLENIYPEAPLPMKYYHLGAIKNVETGFCLDTLGRKEGEDCGASFCHGKGGNQLFQYSKTNNIKFGNLCLDTNGMPGVVKMNTCKKGTLSQQWDYDSENEFFRNRHTSSCLTVYETNNNVLITMNCDPNNKSQKWIFTMPFKLSNERSS